MELIRNDIVMALRFNALVPSDAQDFLQAKSGAVVLPALDPPK